MAELTSGSFGRRPHPDSSAGVLTGIDVGAAGGTARSTDTAPAPNAREVDPARIVLLAADELPGKIAALVGCAERTAPRHAQVGARDGAAPPFGQFEGVVSG